MKNIQCPSCKETGLCTSQIKDYSKPGSPVMGTLTLSCISCDGTGTILIEEIECPGCDGEGSHPMNYCNECSGNQGFYVTEGSNEYHLSEPDDGRIWTWVGCSACNATGIEQGEDSNERARMPLEDGSSRSPSQREVP